MSRDPTARTPPTGFVLLGRIGKPFQLVGGMRFQAVTEVANEAALGAAELFVTGIGLVRVRQARDVAGTPVLYLEGVRDREAAQAAVHAEVWADPRSLAPAVREDLAAAAAGDPLAGVVVQLDGRRVGEVVESFLGGANDVVEVLLDAGGTVLLPLAAPYVRLEDDGIHLDDPPVGLLESR